MPIYYTTEIYTVLWLLFAVTGTVSLYSFKYGGTGFVLGLLFGPMGIIMALVIRHTLVVRENRANHSELMKALQLINQRDIAADEGGKRCPLCDENIKSAAKVCKHCRQVIVKRPKTQGATKAI